MMNFKPFGGCFFKPYHANTYHFANAFGTLPKSNEMILFSAAVLGFWRNMFNIVL